MEDQSPAAVVWALFEAVNRRDWAAASQAYAEDAVLVVPDGLLGGEFRGRDQVTKWFADWMRSFGGHVHFDRREFREAGDDVALSAHHTARGEHSGVELEVDLFYHYRVRDGKVILVAFYETWAEALDAALGTNPGPVPEPGLVRPDPA